MAFSRVKAAGWAMFEVLTSAQMNQLDINTSKAIDGTGGGIYNPSSEIQIGGSGLKVTGPFTVTGSNTITGSSDYVIERTGAGDIELTAEGTGNINLYTDQGAGSGDIQMRISAGAFGFFGGDGTYSFQADANMISSYKFDFESGSELEVNGLLDLNGDVDFNGATPVGLLDFGAGGTDARLRLKWTSYTAGSSYTHTITDGQVINILGSGATTLDIDNDDSAPGDIIFIRNFTSSSATIRDHSNSTITTLAAGEGGVFMRRDFANNWDVVVKG